MAPGADKGGADGEATDMESVIDGEQGTALAPISTAYLKKTLLPAMKPVLSELADIETDISYGATEHSLSDRFLYPHVFRTVQNHNIHNMVVTKLLEHFGWTWVGILVTDDDTGENELQILTKYMREHGICAAFTIKLTEQIVNDNERILQVLKNPQINIIIMCGTLSLNGDRLLYYHSSVFIDKFFILPPSWASSNFILEHQYPELNGSLAVEFSSQTFPGEEDLTTQMDVRKVEIGNFTPWAVSGEQLHINTESITWKWTKEVRSVPVSRCSDLCLPGSRKMARPTIHICCYDCVPCSEGEISNITDSDSCIKCQSDEWPNEKRDRCRPKVVEFISYQNDTIASVFSCVSVFGCLVTGFIFGIFISHRDTPIVKANNRNLSYLLLVSIILSFLSVFLFLGRPNDVTCRLRETSFGIFFSVAVSSLLAKTVMVCVAFKSTKPGSPWRKWLSVKLPYTIVSLCSSFQAVICIIWMSISPPFQDLDTDSYPGKIIIQCNEGSDIWFYSMLGYLGFLAAVSLVLAFMVRTLPDSFNEAKYITFSMLVFCSVWISMIPAYLSTRGKNMVAVEIFAVMASSAGLLGCVFFPKCFIILFKSEMNRKADLLGKRKN
ncbi:vomeronasal type-2 receptor 116-like [Bufo gargarizans]|uniref:vomeronasal type-2 receptor 116-like n=1 Tax=Bufo gargarizans TaxID=30331 RepID=UPI001CF5ADEC|nr:vomeronasal type-2 receptor 116-like [Bufo gargarizans]